MQSPITIAEARKIVTDNFRGLVGLIAKGVCLPEGVRFANRGPLSPDYALSWGGCAIESAQHGLSFGATPADPSDNDMDQVRIEVRYFPKAMVMTAESGKALNLRPGSHQHEAMIFVEMGPNIVGKSRDLVKGDRFSYADDIATLAASVIENINSSLDAATLKNH